MQVETSEEQHRLIQRTSGDILIGSILKDSVCDNVKKKITHHHIDVIDGNVSSYSRSLKNAAQLEYIDDARRLGHVLQRLKATRLLLRKRHRHRRQVKQ